MSQSWYLIDNDMYGDSLQDNKDNFSDLLGSSIAEVVKINSIDHRAIINGKDYRSKNSAYERRIIAEQGILKCGSIVLYHNENWVITTKPENNSIYEKAIIEYCNSLLTVQLADKTIKTIPCVKKSPAMSNSSKENGEIVITNTDVQYIICPINLDTQNLEPNKRLIFNNYKNSIYKITYVDLQDGTMTLTVKHDTYNPDRDNLELNLADYKKDDIPTTQDNYSIKIEGLKEVNCGKSYKYMAKVYNAGIEVGNKLVNWTVDDADNLLKSYTPNSNEITLVTNNKDNTGEFVLKATLQDDNAISNKIDLYVGW